MPALSGFCTFYFHSDIQYIGSSYNIKLAFIAFQIITIRDKSLSFDSSAFTFAMIFFLYKIKLTLY